MPSDAAPATSLTAAPAQARWFLAGSRPADYEWAGEPDPADPTKQIRTLHHRTSTVTDGFGTLMQSFAADKHRGKRMRFSARVRSENVAAWAGLWMRVDGATPRHDRSTLAFDNMEDRAIRGTTEWATYTVVLDVAPEANAIAVGILLSGGGTLWLADPRLEIVGNDVAPTKSQRPAEPSLPEDFTP